jgi:glycosyltransferase involved in cell wall biosynthesis
MDEKIKITFVTPSFGGGGAQRNLIHIVNSLDKSRFEVSIICLISEGPFYDLIDKETVAVISCSHPSVYFSIFKIYKIIKEVKPDIVVSWMGFLNAYLSFFIPLFPKRIKWICRESSIPSVANKQFTFSVLFSFLYKFLNRYHNIICQSEAMAEDLVEAYNVDKDKITIIKNPIDISAVNKGVGSVKYGCENKKGIYRLLFVGGLRKVKRVGLLLEALALLPEKYHLTIIGSGEELSDIENQIRILNLEAKVTILQNCFNPYPYYADSDCLLLSSLVEGFPNVVLEAFSCGCPAIGFNVKGGANEVLEDYGGFVVGGNSYKDFAAQIITVCEQVKVDRIKIKADCQAKYDLSKIVSQFENIFIPESF